MSSKWLLSNYHKSKKMELKLGMATILYKYSDLTKFDKNLEGSRLSFVDLKWNDPPLKGYKLGNELLPPVRY